jgi:predicted nucleic acid-binding protein
MASKKVVVTDANVLINLLQVERIDLCARLPGLEFVVPDHVCDEIQRPALREQLLAGVDRGVLAVERLSELASLKLFAELAENLGRGESACLAIAIERGWMLASDEKRRFRREAEDRIGRDRLLGTADLYVLAIRAGILTVEEADVDKAILEQRRFRMNIASFAELW